MPGAMLETFKSLADYSWISSTEAWIGLLTLVALEVVLGIDNIVFISILTNKLPREQQDAARKRGLLLAVLPRIIFLLLLGLILSLQQPLFYLPFQDPDPSRCSANGDGHCGLLGLSGQDLVLIVGGLFLLWQAVREIHHKLEGGETASGGSAAGKAATWGVVITQIMFMNIIFSLDSIVTAIGMVKQVPIMILAVMISTAIMIYAVNPISRFVEKHPTVKMLALSFLLLIGTNLIIEAIHFHIPKGYVYFAMAFSVAVEMLNIRAAKGRGAPVHLHPPAE